MNLKNEKKENLIGGHNNLKDGKPLGESCIPKRPSSSKQLQTNNNEKRANKISK